MITKNLTKSYNKNNYFSSQSILAELQAIIFKKYATFFRSNFCEAIKLKEARNKTNKAFGTSEKPRFFEKFLGRENCENATVAKSCATQEICSDNKINEKDGFSWSPSVNFSLNTDSNEQQKIEQFLAKLKFNESGLICAIAQEATTGKVLMQAWMNKESIISSFESGFATYFSRSRQKLWQKGESSGNVSKIISITADCDFDCLLLQVLQVGAACHTGEKSCFFNFA